METYDRAEIVEDRNAKKLRIFLFTGIKLEIQPVRDLLEDVADSEIDKIRGEITQKYGIPYSRISKRIKGSFPP